MTEKLRKSLEDTFNEKHLTGFDKLKLSLLDGTSELKTGKIGKTWDKDKEIKVSLSLNNLTSKDDIKIKIKYNLDLKTKWQSFIEQVTKNNNQLINSIEWSKFKDDDKWNALREEILTKLKDAWKLYKLENIDYNLIIDLYDKDRNPLKDRDITKQDVDNIKNITIELSYKDKKTDDFTEKINNIAIKLDYSLKTKWANFTASVKEKNIFKNFKWNKFKDNENTWELVIDLIKDQLKNLWIDSNLSENDFNNLYITLEDDSKKLAGIIDKKYVDAPWTITIKLHYNKESELKYKESVENIQLSKSINSKWTDFIREITKNDNELIKSIDWNQINDLTTWEDMANHLWAKLKPIFTSKHKLGGFNKLNINFFYGIKELIDQNISKYSNKEITIKLTYLLDDQKLVDEIPFTLPTIKDSQQTRWANFISDVKNNKLLDKKEIWNDITDLTTWKDLTE
ncbi:MAG: hypothetical protein E7Y34_01945, partial [Mycoplasma sp.]|nr:hypothetical protein [Mycoplasma sp.]